jgi:DNA-binding PucR family transcriptional regulator
MSSLAKLIDDLRPYVITVLAAPRGLSVPVKSVVIHDATDPVEIGQGDIVFGVGVEPAHALPLAEYAATAEAAALVLKTKPPSDHSLIDAAERLGLALLAVPPGASWVQLVTLVRAVLARRSSDPSPIGLSELDSGDLFGMANAISAMVNAPVTIEDLQSRVIAYSGRQDEADEPRIQTILGRRVPETIVQRLREEGVFERLACSSEPVYFEPGEASVMGREAIAIRAGGEVVGFIWAAVKEPLGAEKRQLLVEAAHLVAIQVTRRGLDADITRRIRADLAASMLEGRPDAAEAAQQLGLAGDRFRVVAGWATQEGTGDRDLMRLRLWDLLAFHISTPFKFLATTLTGGMAYAVVRTSSSDEVDRERLLQAATTLHQRALSTLQANLVIGIGGPASGLSEIPRSREEAEQTVSVLRSRPEGPYAADVEQVRTEILLRRVIRLLSADPSLRTGRLRTIRDYDAKHGSDYLASLRAYLDTFGDTPAAAERLRVHPNTLRYRLQRLREVAGLQLQDPGERLLLMLQLRLLENASPEDPP